MLNLVHLTQCEHKRIGQTNRSNPNLRVSETGGVADDYVESCSLDHNTKESVRQIASCNPSLRVSGQETLLTILLNLVDLTQCEYKRVGHTNRIV